MGRRDERITRRVVKRRRSNPELKGSAIIVGVYDRRVTLRGTVADPFARIAACADAWRVRAVRAVADQLAMHEPSARLLDLDHLLETTLT